MNHVLKTTAVIFFIFSLYSCGSDDSPSEQDKAFEALKGQWTTDSNGFIKLDGQNVSLNYTSFSLSFDSESYQTTSAGSLFKATGTWEWFDKEANKITLDDGKTVTILELTSNRFHFTFTHQGTGGVINTINGQSGSYEILLSK